MIGPDGTIYGQEFTFTTLSVTPFLSSTAATAITGTTATSGGNITDNGGEAVTARGVCWSTAHNPTVADSKTSDLTGSGTFTSAITGMLGKTTYYARAYATNKIGTSYGNEITFMTLVALPTLTTNAVTGITADGATSGGVITLTGGDAILEKGVCWGTTDTPTVDTNRSTDGTGATAFSSTLVRLSVATTYYVRAYAKNSAGYGYGPAVKFMTFPTALYMVGGVTEPGWDINNLSLKIEQSTTPGIYVGIFNLTGGKELKFFSNQGQWQPQWGMGTSAGVLGVNLGGGSDPNTIVTPAATANYKVTVDLGAMTYKIESAYPTALYMIGDGVGDPSWSWDKTDLPMVPVNSHPNLFWKIVWMNASGSFKFAPEKAWGKDFGKVQDQVASGAVSDNNGMVYDKGGQNVPVPGTAGYYMVVVDLAANKISIANARVYLIGNSIGSWDTANPRGLFQFVDNGIKQLKIDSVLGYYGGQELRMYAWHGWFTDWWQSEFILINDQIVFRGTGGDQPRVNTGPLLIYLDFINGVGRNW